jgi:hypothetical protein
VTDTRFSDDLIVQYLLGELSENQQVELEDRAFEDPVLVSNITAVEHDLIDDYAAGRIRGERLERFESHFLASAERRKKVAFAKALKGVIADSESRDAALDKTHERPFFARLFTFLARPAPAYAFAASAFVLMIAAAWLVMKARTLNSEVARLRAAQETQSSERRQLEAELNNQRARSEDLAAQLEQAQQQTSPVPQEPEKPRSPIIAALTLLPGVSRSGSTTPRLTLPKDATTLRLQIVLDPNETYRVFSAVVTGGGQTVYSGSRLVPTTSRAGRSIRLNVAASALKVGRYEVSLKGLSNSGPIDVGYYYFDLDKK